MENELYLGVSREVITPPLGVYLGGYPFPDRFAVAVHDDLTVTALAFRYGEMRSMLISATIAVLDESICSKLRTKIEADTGIPAQNIIIHSTHTHSAPVTFTSEGWGEANVDYIEKIFIPKTILASKYASENEQAVTVGFAQGKSFAGVNRREPSRINNGVKLGCWEYGCFDPKMSVISFKNEGGDCVANIVHYGCHATAAGTNLEITRDWPGVMTDELEKVSGGITAFFNGPEGDVGPRLSNGKTTGEGDIRYAMEQGAVAASDAVAIYESIDEYSNVAMKCTELPVRLPVDPRMSYEEAVDKLNAAEGKAGIVLREASYYAQIINAYETNEPIVEYKEHRQTLIRIGDVAFVAQPFETFSEIGLRINVMSEIPHVLCVALANGNECYLPTKWDIPRGGYEVRMFESYGIQRYTNDVDFALITETVKNLKEII